MSPRPSWSLSTPVMVLTLAACASTPTTGDPLPAPIVLPSLEPACAAAQAKALCGVEYTCACRVELGARAQDGRVTGVELQVVMTPQPIDAGDIEVERYLAMPSGGGLALGPVVHMGAPSELLGIALGAFQDADGGPGLVARVTTRERTRREAQNALVTRTEERHLYCTLIEPERVGCADLPVGEEVVIAPLDVARPAPPARLGQGIDEIVAGAWRIALALDESESSLTITRAVGTLPDGIATLVGVRPLWQLQADWAPPEDP